MYRFHVGPPWEQGGAAACSRKSILNLSWWSDSLIIHIVTSFLSCCCSLLYLNIKYLGKLAILVCTLMDLKSPPPTHTNPLI